MNSPDDATEHDLPRERENEKASRPVSEIVSPTDDEPSQGPNLVLLYCFLALALAVAIGIAALIVLPFYHRH
jgi:hypothetical protein